MINFNVRQMTEADLPKVLEVESRSHSHPWTEGNFLDSLKSGYWCYIFEDKEPRACLLGYCVLMPGVDELHLLNITVDQNHRRQKIAYRALLAMEPLAIERSMGSIILEVRQSNVSAIKLYQLLGFRQISIRKGYYRLSTPTGLDREDAIVMVKGLLGH